MESSRCTSDPLFRHNSYSLFLSFFGLVWLQPQYNQEDHYLPILKKCWFYKCCYIRYLLKSEKLVNIFNGRRLCRCLCSSVFEKWDSRPILSLGIWGEIWSFRRLRGRQILGPKKGACDYVTICSEVMTLDSKMPSGFWASCLSMISKDNEAMQSWPTLSHYGIICGGFTRVGDCT